MSELSCLSSLKTVYTEKIFYEFFQVLSMFFFSFHDQFKYFYLFCYSKNIDDEITAAALSHVKVVKNKITYHRSTCNTACLLIDVTNKIRNKSPICRLCLVFDYSYSGTGERSRDWLEIIFYVCFVILITGLGCKVVVLCLHYHLLYIQNL